MPETLRSSLEEPITGGQALMYNVACSTLFLDANGSARADLAPEDLLQAWHNRYPDRKVLLVAVTSADKMLTRDLQDRGFQKLDAREHEWIESHFPFKKTQPGRLGFDWDEVYYGFKLPWDFISHIPQSWSYENQEIRALAKLWQEQRGTLSAKQGLDRFNEELKREWAIETGVLEHLYEIDRGVTHTLIVHGIEAAYIPREATNKSPIAVVSVIRDHLEVVDSLFDFIGSGRQITVGYIKEIHAALTRHQTHAEALSPNGQIVMVPLIRGDYKRLPNNPTRPDGSVHNYCPPEHVAAEMDCLINLFASESTRWPPEVMAAWLHHRFTQIHPFQDGNGRVARCLATLVFLKENWFPLVLTREHKVDYIVALEVADAGDLAPLVDLFSKVQKQAMLKALSLSERVLATEPVSHVIAAAKESLQRRRDEKRHALQRAKQIGAELMRVVKERLDELSGQIRQELGPFLDDLVIKVHFELPDSERSSYNRYQVVRLARILDYYANWQDFHSFATLVLEVGHSTFEILVSCHTLGPEYRGILGISAGSYHRESTESGNWVVESTLTAICTEVFQLNYFDDPDDATKRFKAWLEQALVVGLEGWRRQL